VDDVYRSDGTVYTDDQWHWSGEWQVQGRVVKIHWRAGPNNPECVDTLTLNDAGTMLMGTNSLSDDIAHLRIAERVDLSRDKSTKPAH
jgi:hypothetical protein